MLQNGKIAGPKLFVTPAQDEVKPVVPPFLKGGKILRPPSLWLKLQTTA